jgi:hypothetical protein
MTNILSGKKFRFDFSLLHITVVCVCDHFFFGSTALYGPGPPRFVEVSWSHTTVGRTPLDEWSARRRDNLTTHNTSQETDIHAPGGIRTHNPSNRAAEDPRLRAHGHWDRRDHMYIFIIIIIIIIIIAFNAGWVNLNFFEGDGE